MPSHGSPTQPETLLAVAEEISGFGSFSWNVPEDVLEWSDGLLSIYGITRSSFSGSADAYFQRLHPEDQEAVRLALKDAIRNGGRFENTERILRPDGEIRWLETRGQLTTDSDNNPLRLVGVCHDITNGVRYSDELRRQVHERKLLESRLLQMQKVQALGNLVNGIAHDFNNLLTVVMSGCELLNQLPSSALRDDARDVVRSIDEAAELGNQLTRQLLRFGRSSKGQLVAVDLNKAVMDSRRVLNQSLIGNIELSISLSPSEPVVKIDPTRLQQILLNLAVNARDAMPSGGKLSIRTDTVSRALIRNEPNASSQYAVLEFSDTGIGIPDDVREQMFDPFFTTKSDDSGTGLGLSVVDGIVRVAGGFIEVDSSVSRGALIRIYLPTVREVADRPDKDIRMRRSGKKEEPRSRTIFIVEDEPTVLKSISDIYQRLGFQTVTATDSVEAIRVVKEGTHPIDMILTDVSMPTLSGPDMVAAIQGDQESFPIPVLYMSGNDEELLKNTYGISGEGNSIRKPIRVADLIRKTEALLSPG